jgi:hypothetical protein
MDSVDLDQAGWEQHVAGCRHLQELHVATNIVDITTHLTMVLRALAGTLTQLRTLWVTEEDIEQFWGMQHLEMVIDMLLDALPDADSDDSDGEEQWWPRPPLGQAQGFDNPEGYMAVPPPNMGGLPALQQLRMRGWWLVVSSKRHWRHLAACSSLRHLSNLHTTVPPPAGVAFPGVTQLEVTTSTSLGDTLTLLAAFPALKELKLDVVMQAVSANEVSAHCAWPVAVMTICCWVMGEWQPACCAGHAFATN